jgi:uncharacterized protein
MSGLYIIPLSGLKEGRHTYNFEIGKSFFGLFEGSEINEGDLTAYIELDKHSSHLDIKFTIKGTVRINCDRCLEEYSQPIDCENRLLVKTGSRWEEEDPDLISMPVDEHELDLNQYLYEYIHLALPLQRVHPVDAAGKSTCDPEMIKRISGYDGNDETDPRWDELKKLMNNN